LCPIAEVFDYEVIGYYGCVTWFAGVLANGNLSEKLGRFLAGERWRMAEVLNLRAVGRRAGRHPHPTLLLHEGLVASKAGVSRGMSKADRALARLNRQKIARELDEHRIETGEADEIAGR
jgi:hypothetical protein